MGNWTIVPSGGVINNNDGTFILPENTEETNIVYNITYIDDNGCSVSKSLTVKSGTSCQTYSFEVTSDVEGATVTWGDGTTGTIVNGLASTTKKGVTSLTATLTKNGCTFGPNNGSAINANGTINITGSCSAPIVCEHKNGIERLNIDGLDKIPYDDSTRNYVGFYFRFTTEHFQYTNDCESDSKVFGATIYTPFQGDDGDSMEVSFHENSSVVFEDLNVKYNIEGYSYDKERNINLDYAENSDFKLISYSGIINYMDVSFGGSNRGYLSGLSLNDFDIIEEYYGDDTNTYEVTYESKETIDGIDGHNLEIYILISYAPDGWLYRISFNGLQYIHN